MGWRGGGAGFTRFRLWGSVWPCVPSCELVVIGNCIQWVLPSFVCNLRKKWVLGLTIAGFFMSFARSDQVQWHGIAAAAAWWQCQQWSLTWSDLRHLLKRDCARLSCRFRPSPSCRNLHGLKASSLTTGTVLWATVKFYDTSNRGILHGLTVARQRRNVAGLCLHSLYSDGSSERPNHGSLSFEPLRFSPLLPTSSVWCEVQPRLLQPAY